MSQLKSLKVSGIRSFGPEKSQVIKFQPLTLILGVNGAGKTSIIECLKFVTSGEFPPGTSAGKTWIHDPQLQSKGSVVVANVALEFKAKDEVMHVAGRIMEMTTKRATTGKVTQTLRTKDTVIQRKVQGEKEATLGGRCADIDKAMLDLLGVSKAVLTNVIFCHQDDNCWPLSEGRILKEKFDLIFGSMGYVKALDKIKKYRASKATELKSLKTIEEKFIEIKTNKDKMAKDLERVVKEFDMCKVKKTKVDETLKSIQETLQATSKEEEEMFFVMTKVSKISGRMKEKELSLKRLQDKIHEEFDGTIEELNEQKDKFKRELSGKQGELDTITRNIKELNTDIVSNQNKKQAFSKKMGKLEEQEDSYKRNLEKRVTTFQRVIKEGGFTFDLASDDDNDGFAKIIQDIVTQITEKIKREEDDHKKVVETIEGTIKELEESVDKHKTNKTKLMAIIRMKEETQIKREREMKMLLKKVEDIQSSGSKMVGHSGDIMEAIIEMKEKLTDDTITEQVESRVSEMKVTQFKLQDEVMDLMKTYTDLSRENLSSVSDLKKEKEAADAQLSEASANLMTQKKQLKDHSKFRSPDSDNLNKWRNELTRVHESVVENPYLANTSNVESLKDQITEAKEYIDKKEAEKVELESRKQELQKDISDQEIIVRDFIDNEQLIQLKSEVIEMKEQLRAAEVDTKKLDPSSLEKKSSSLKSEQNSLLANQGHLKGQMMSLQEQRNRLKKDLEQSRYQLVDQDYKEAVINSVTCEMLCDDLNKYYRVLDKAVSTYHARRMDQINQQIGHFWRTTYQGTDISTVKIVCDDSEGASADKRKTYNYRVVMVKGGVDLDMRGRCSAGQKVLASLVIRLSLAQIFCADCSILTLDEPTTNLDKENIHALAKAICDLVEEQRGKIQIVIITHDSEFLKYMNEEFSQYYYEVVRGENGYSCIVRKELNERDE